MIYIFGPPAAFTCLNLEELSLSPPKTDFNLYQKEERHPVLLVVPVKPAPPVTPPFQAPRCMSRSLESFPKGSSISCQMDSSNFDGG